jgi:Bacterial pre-peptidase C-terminal domain/Peptidase M10 serralysin C terminal
MAILSKTDLATSTQPIVAEKTRSPFDLNSYFRQASRTLSANNNPPDNAGNTLATAQVVSIGNIPTLFQDFVGAVDTNDYYRFTLSTASDFSLTLSGLTADANVQLLNSSGGVLQSSLFVGTFTDSISSQLAAGTYYVRVYPAIASFNTNYTLSLAAAPPDQAGNSLAFARGITVGTTPTTFRDYVGSTDTNDYYRFTFFSTQTLSLALNGMSADADVQLLDGAGGVIATSEADGTNAESINRQLGIGIYYIRVYPYNNANTNYSLSVSTQAPLPSLSIAATDANAAETNSGQTANPGVFTITRTGSTSSALAVNYTVGGSASKGGDYNNITGNTGNTGTITIPVGATSATITLNVVNDTAVEGNETVTLTLSPLAGYQIGTSSATVTIADNDTNTVSDPTVSSFSLTGNTQIDALLNPIRTLWNTSNSGGNITYSFYSNSSGSYYGSELVSAVSDAIKTNVRNILASLSTFINVNFVEVTDTVGSFGVLRYMFSSGPGYAYAYYPSTDRRGGDVHLSSLYESDTVNRFSGTPGSYGYMALIHETLHALGLKHPGNYDAGGGGTEGPYLNPSEDNVTNTLMTYNTDGARAITAMTYDIRALQYLYGARNYNSSATTYSFNSLSSYTVNGQMFGTSTSNKQTIWDSGGIDTFNFSGLSTSSTYRFDLRQGGILTTQGAFNGTTYVDAATSGTFRTTTNGTTIAFNTVIENLVNSRANDYIIANDAANTFSGYALSTATGNDVYEGTSSQDILDLSSYSLSNLNASVSGGNLTIGLGTGGSIQVLNYYGASGSMRVRIGSSLYVYNSSSGWQTVSSMTPASSTTVVTSGGLTSQRGTTSNRNLSRAVACQCASCSLDRRLNQLGNSSLSQMIGHS